MMWGAKERRQQESAYDSRQMFVLDCDVGTRRGSVDSKCKGRSSAAQADSRILNVEFGRAAHGIAEEW